MSLTALEQRAIRWYSEEYSLMPQLSARPIMYFKKRSTGEEVKIDLFAITSAYNGRQRKEKATK